MEKENKYNEMDHQEQNKRTSPTDIKGKDLENANATNSGAGSTPIEEAPNSAINSNPIEEQENQKNQNPSNAQKNKEHTTQQDETRYQGSKNNQGMDTDLNMTERSQNTNAIQNNEDKTDGI